jgi:hypothetical protein
VIPPNAAVKGLALRSACVLSPVLLLCILPSFLTHARSDRAAGERRQGLSEQQAVLQRAQQDLQAKCDELRRKRLLLESAPITQSMLEQSTLELDAARVQAEGTKLDEQSAQRQVQQLEAAVHDLDSQVQALKAAPAVPETGIPAEQQLAQAEASLTQKRADLDLERQRLDNAHLAR